MNKILLMVELILAVNLLGLTNFMYIVESGSPFAVYDSQLTPTVTKLSGN